MKNKRGDYKYYLLASLIVGLLVLSLSLYFIFKEYFTEDDANWESCRQSLVLRNSMPEKDLKVLVGSSKSLLPIKCQNSVINIDYKDTERAEKEIANVIGSCWYLSGEGNYKVFPGSKWAEDVGTTPCLVCSRIHIDPKVADYYSDYSNKETTISLKRALESNMVDKETSFWNYLYSSTGKKAFMYFNGWEDSGFSITKFTSNSLTGGISKGIPDDARVFSFPRTFNLSKGDLYIFYVEPSGVLLTSDIRDVKPYMVIMNQKELNNLSEIWTSYGLLKLNLPVCSSVESVVV